MASTNKTSRGLSQFEGNDRLKRDDYNNDMKKIDEELNGLDQNKEPKFTKKGGFNKEKTDSVTTDSSVILATAKAIKTVWDALTSHRNSTTNPHTVTKNQVGLGNVPNYLITDSVGDNSSSKFGSAKGVKAAYDRGTEGVNKANNAVPKTRKINGTTLDKDITLTVNNISGSAYGHLGEDEYVKAYRIPSQETGDVWVSIVNKDDSIIDENYRNSISLYVEGRISATDSQTGSRCLFEKLNGNWFVKKIWGSGLGSNQIDFDVINGIPSLKHSHYSTSYSANVHHRLTSSSTDKNFLFKFPALDDHIHSFGQITGCQYDIGDYWITESTANPATKWTGTTWTKLEGRVLLGTSSGYALGSQGGSSTHTLTLSEMVRHRHLVDSHLHSKAPHRHTYVGVSWDDRISAGGESERGGVDLGKNTELAGGENTGAAAPYTDYQGSGSAFNIMNPYRVVNIWRRTA